MALFRHSFSPASSAFDGGLATLALGGGAKQVFLTRFLTTPSIDAREEEGVVTEPDPVPLRAFDSVADAYYGVVTELTAVKFVLSTVNMPVSYVGLLVNSANDLGTATETDVTSSFAPSGGTFTYNVGGANQLRYYWIKLRDEASNTTIETLGAYTTGDFTAPSVDTFTLAAGAAPTSEIVVGLGASDNDAVQTLYLMVSSTQTTAPTAAAIKASGTALAGATTAHTITGLDSGTTYYGWVLATDRVGNDSAVVASVPATLATAADTVPPTLDSFALAATVGAEESSVDITISISDVVA